MTEEDAERLLTIREAAGIVGISPRTIARWVQRGELACITAPNGQILIRRADVEAITVTRERNDE
jgi:excisionase family DNA binding protein